MQNAAGFVPVWLAPTAALACALLTVLGCAIVSRAGLLPNPVSARSAHTAPVSRAGGVVIGLVFGVVMLVCLSLSAPAAVVVNLVVLIACAGALGAVDDAADLPALVKLAALVVISGLVALAAGPIPSVPIPFVGWLALPEKLGLLLTAFWVLGFVNVFNFMDGLDGMAATTGVVVLGGMGLLAAGLGAPGPHLLAVCMAAAVWGFALLNVTRGRPFLGDAGSLAVGVAIAGGLAALPGAARLGPDLSGAPFWLLAAGAVPFVADAGLTLLSRASEGEPVMSAHADHAYQRLRRAGYSHQAVGLAYGLITAMVVLLAALFVLGVLPGGYGPGAPWLLAVLALAAWAVTVRIMFARAAGEPEDQDARATEDSASDSSVSRSGLGGRLSNDRAALTAYP